MTATITKYLGEQRVIRWQMHLTAKFLLLNFWEGYLPEQWGISLVNKLNFIYRGLPFFRDLGSYLAIVGFALLLSKWNGEAGCHTDCKSQLMYEPYILTIGQESESAYKLIPLEVAFNGGNRSTYLKTSKEYFTGPKIK